MILVLQRVICGTSRYEAIVRPYQIQQPKECPPLGPLYPRSEGQLLMESAYVLVDMVGLQRAVEELKNADPQSVPEIQYQILRES